MKYAQPDDSLSASRRGSASATRAEPVAIHTAMPTAAPTVDRLLDTAAALFWKKGYAATTMREIAATVGIQQASLYHHMASQEHLL